MPSRFDQPVDHSHYGGGLVPKALTWLFCLALVIATWLFVAQQIRFERDHAIQEAIAQNENRAIGFEQYVRRTLEVAAVATRYVADRFQRGIPGPEFSGTPDRPASLAGDLARGDTIFAGIIIANARGDIIAMSRAGSGPRNVAPLPAFQVHVARNSDELFVSPPFRAPMLGRDVIMLSRRLNNPDGSFAGIVALAIAPEQFTAFYRDARIGPRDIMSLIGLDGITRARRVGERPSAGEDMRGTGVMQRVVNNPNGTTKAAASIDGVVRYFSRRRLADYPLFVAYGVPESEILAVPQRRARSLIAIAALGTLAAIGFAALLTLLINRNERRAREMALANRRLQEAQRIGQIGDWDYDLRTGSTYWSPQLCTQFERRPEQGSPSLDEFLAYLDEEGRETVKSAHSAAIETGESQEVEYDVHLPSGAENRHQASVIPTFDRNGNVIGLHGTDQTITGRKLLEQLQGRLAHLSRVEAMNTMAGTLAHELNQPLAAAANYVAGTRRHLETSPDDVAGTDEGLVAAEQQILFAGDIIRRVREMVSSQPKAVSNFSLTTVVDDALTVIIAAGGSAPSVSRELDPQARRVRADRVQVQQVIINLLRNALEATQDLAEPRVVIASRADENGMVIISVADNGPGFSRPKAERFSPVAGGNGAGMGLGLSISRTIVEANGGRIWTEDEVEGGAIVCFTLPAAPHRGASIQTIKEA
ncbi:MAG: ATP-binding protein [Sphingomonas sp.]